MVVCWENSVGLKWHSYDTIEERNVEERDVEETTAWVKGRPDINFQFVFFFTVCVFEAHNCEKDVDVEAHGLKIYRVACSEVSLEKPRVVLVPNLAIW